MKNSISSRVSCSPSRFFRITSCGLNQFSSTTRHHHHRLGRNSKPLSNCVEAFCRLRLHTYHGSIHTEDLRDLLAHGKNVWSELRRLQHYRGIYIHNLSAALMRQPNNARE